MGACGGKRMIRLRASVRIQSENILAYEFLYTIIYIVIAVFLTLDATQFSLLIPKYSLILKLIKLGAVAVLPIVLTFRGGITKKGLLIGCVAGTVFLLVTVNTNKSTINLLLLVLLMICGRSLNSNKLLKMYFLSISAILLVCFLFWRIGIFKNEYSIGLNGARHYYIGFTYFSYYHNHFLNAILVYFAIKKKQITLIETAVILLLNHYFYILCDTTAPYLLIYASLLLFWILRFVPKLFDTKIFYYSVVLMPFVCGIVIVLLSAFYNNKNPNFAWLNETLSDRLALGHEAINRYGIPLFGSDVEWKVGADIARKGANYFYVDSSYLNNIITYGLVITALMAFGFSFIGSKMHKEKKYVVCIVLLVMAVHGFSDPQYFSLKYNPFIVYIGAAYASTICIPAVQATSQNIITSLIKRSGAGSWLSKNP